MANYNVDIAIALKNSNKLMQLRKELKSATENQIRFNKAAKEANGLAVVTFNKLNKVLSRARSNLDKAALGTASFRRSAKALVNVEKEHNKQLIEKEKLLNKLRIQADPNFIVREQRKLQIQENIRQLRTRKFGNVNPSRPADITFGQVGGKIGPAQLIDNRQGGFLAFSKVADQIKKDTKDISSFTKKSSQLLTQQVANKGFTGAFGGDTGVQFGVPGGKIGPALPRGFRLRQQFAPGGAFFNSRGTAGRISSGLQSGLIGGGFPLLFGQGGAGAIAGGLGGALGGALSPGFGFAGSIAATAITQQIQQTLEFRKSIRELNKEMEQMGISSNISGSQVRQLGKSLGITKEEAVKALQEFKRFGNQAVLFAEKFGGDFAKFDAIAQANTVQSALAAIRKINKDLTLDDELRFINSVRRVGVEATINQMLDEMLEKEKKLKTAGFGQGEGKNAGANRKRMSQLNQEKNATQELVDKNKAFSAELTIIRDKFVENRDAAEAANRGIRKGLEDVNAEIRKLNDAQFQVVELSKTLGSSFSESFKGIIKGTMSVGDAFRNMFMRIADHFLDMAAQMMAAQISRGFMGMFGSLFSGFGGGLASSAQLGAQATAMTGIPSGAALPAGSFGISSITRAAGGPVKGGSSYLVGERGPEMFSPGVSGMITPNHELGGGTNIVVNVDASGSNVEGDEEEGRALGIALSAAIETELIKQKRPGGLLA